MDESSSANRESQRIIRESQRVPVSNDNSLSKRRKRIQEQYTRVEAERMEAEMGDGYGYSQPPFAMPKPPIIATWLCLILAWFFLGSSIPFTVLIGLPANVGALVLSLVCLTRGGIFTGLIVLLLGTVGSFIVYFIGFASMFLH